MNKRRTPSPVLRHQPAKEARSPTIRYIKYINISKHVSICSFGLFISINLQRNLIPPRHWVSLFSYWSMSQTLYSDWTKVVGFVIGGTTRSQYDCCYSPTSYSYCYSTGRVQLNHTIPSTTIDPPMCHWYLP